jgi:chitinase
MKSVAYYTGWSTYGRDFQVSQIPGDQVSHINYAFANVSDGQCVLGDPYADTDKFFPGDSWDAGAKRGNFNQLNKLKSANPGLETLISVGGWTWSANFSAAAATQQSRSEFATSCVKFMKDWGFDGIDIDWEYPVSGGLQPGTAADKVNYTLLLEALRSELDRQEQADGGRSYLLTIAAPAGPATRANLESAKISGILDWINVMAYDLHGPWEPAAGHNAPLYASPNDPGPASLNVDAAISGYLSAGVDPSKLVVGVPFYGRSMLAATTNNNGLFQPHLGAGVGTWEPGLVDYADIVDNYLPTHTRLWDDAAKVPYLYNAQTNTFVSYDDPESIRYKAEYIRDKGLGGGMFWELSSDSSDNALLDALNSGMR